MFIDDYREHLGVEVICKVLVTAQVLFRRI